MKYSYDCYRKDRKSTVSFPFDRWEWMFRTKHAKRSNCRHKFTKIMSRKEKKKPNLREFNASMTEDERDRYWNRLIDLAGLDSFKYYDQKGIEDDSKFVVRDILLNFSNNFEPMQLPNNCTLKHGKKDKFAFYRKLFQQLKTLLGHLPIFVDYGQNVYSIRYTDYS